MENTAQLLHRLAVERPVGTEGNNRLLDMVETMLMKMGYSVSSLPFGCNVWQAGPSAMTSERREIRCRQGPPVRGTNRG